MEIQIGKIKSVRFGTGGYQDAMIGFTFDLGSEKNSWGIGDFWGYWSGPVDRLTKWTDGQRWVSLGETVMRVSALMKDANVSILEDLKGIPIEVTLEGNALKSWRVLTEAI